MRSSVFVLAAAALASAAPMYQMWLSLNLSLYLPTSATIGHETSSSLPAATPSIRATKNDDNDSPRATTSNASMSTAFPNLQRLGQTLLSNDSSPRSDWERTLLARLDRIRENCGELCAINNLQSLEKYTVKPKNETAVSMRQLKVPVDCDAIMLDEEIDASDNAIPKAPPEELIPYYTMGGAIDRGFLYVNQTYAGTTAGIPVWTQGMIDRQFQKIWKLEQQNFTQRRIGVGSYGRQSTEMFLRVKEYIPMKNARVLVIGSEAPWLEGAALYLGASEVVTLEYGRIESRVPKLIPYLPSEFRELYRNKTLGLFDVVLSFSSVEHSGLGRYGDALNPWADLLALARARCVTKPGGYLGLAVPVERRQSLRDIIIFNEKRLYGPHRYPLLTANWEQLDGEKHRHRSRKVHPPYAFRNPSN